MQSVKRRGEAMASIPPEVEEIAAELSRRLDDLANQTGEAIEARDWQRVYATSRYAEGMQAALSVIWRMYRFGAYEQKGQ